MQIGILSDTHDNLPRTLRAVQRLIGEGVQTLVHCGDLTHPEIVYACGDLPAYFVLGNNDFEEIALRGAVQAIGAVFLEWGGSIEVAGRTLAVTHGHLKGELDRLLATQPDYLLFGHSHQTQDRRVQGTRWINPGALHRARRHTVALLDLSEDTVRFVEIA